jgi:flagellar protein FliO/FliZ
MMEVQEILYALFSLIFVLSLIGICAFVLRRFVLERNFAITGSNTKRLRIIEHIALDPRRRLMIVEKDGKEEITILLGASGETLISTSAVKKKN